MMIGRSKSGTTFSRNRIELMRLSGAQNVSFITSESNIRFLKQSRRQRKQRSKRDCRRLLR